MPEYNSAVEPRLEETLDDIWDQMESLLTEDAFEKLDDHVSEIRGYNRGNTSSINTSAREGPPIQPTTLTIQNDGSNRVIYHELWHALMDAHGIDATQEATNRANNKSNYSRWPQFSFGKKDSPAERFMLRRYGDIEELPTTPFDADKLDYVTDRSDIFHMPGYSNEWWEADSYGYSEGHRETQRHIDPMVTPIGGGDPVGIKICALHGYSTKKLEPGVGSWDKDVRIVDRYQLTPGMSWALHDEKLDFSGVNRVAQQVNYHWYMAALGVRKRGDVRRAAQMKTPRGPSNSYYLMNSHEFIAETGAQVTKAKLDDYTTNVERMREHSPGLIEAIEEELLA